MRIGARWLLAAVLLAGLLPANRAAAEAPASTAPRYENAAAAPLARGSAPRFRYRMASRDQATAETIPAPQGEPAPMSDPAPEPAYSFEGYDGAQVAPGDGGEFVDGPPPEGVYPEGPYEGGFEGGPPCAGDNYCPHCGRSDSDFGFCHHFDFHRIYVRADYLLWWGKGFWAPPLVSSSVDGTPRTDAGVLGLPTTFVLFPNGNLADTLQSGGRVRLGYWFDPCDTVGVEGTYFAIGESSTHFNASDDDYPILARPFVNIGPNSAENDAELVAYPELFSGSISVNGQSRLQGADVILRHAICRGCDWRVDWLAGWRFNRLDETLVISDQKEVLSSETGLVVGTTLAEFDRFSTRNYFNGVQVGMITELRRCRWWVETRGIIALGGTHAIVNIDGQTTAVVPVPGGGSETFVTESGLLAQSTNIGRYTDDSFAVVPQLGVNLGFEITCGLWATVGYNFMYWSRVLRPGDQIDTDVNLTQLSPDGLQGLPRPEYPDIHTDYWAQGLNFGLAYRF
jgi:hypothetical protein